MSAAYAIVSTSVLRKGDLVVLIFRVCFSRAEILSTSSCGFPLYTLSARQLSHK